MFTFKLIPPVLLSSILGLVIMPSVARAENTFESKTVLPPNTTEVSGSLTPMTFVNNAPVFFTIPDLEPSEPFLAWIDNSFSRIDTVLGSFDESLNLINFEDDGSPMGDGLGSALVGEVNSDGTINLGVTGYSDFSFTGDTRQAGQFDLYVQLGVDSFAELESDNHDVHEHEHDHEDDDPLAPYKGEDGTFDHIHEETVDTSEVDYSFTGQITQDTPNLGSVDFYNFNNLTPGQVLTASIIQGDIDSVIGLFDEEGNLLKVDDDGGLGSLSRMSDIVVPENGELNLAVAGYPDFEFVGRQLEDGDYVLSLQHQVPEPMTILGTGLVLAFFVKLKKL